MSGLQNWIDNLDPMVAFLVMGVMLVLFPIVTSTVLAVGALATSLWLAGIAVARRRRRRESDVY